MGKHFTFSLFGLVLMVFAGYIFIAGSPLQRINHICAPVAWGGKLTTSVVSVFSHNGAESAWHGTQSTFQDCRYVVFQTFYRTEYEELRAREVAAEKTAKAKPAAAAADTGAKQ